MDSFTITDVIEYEDSEIRPVIAEFQNGRLHNTDVQHELYKKDAKTFVKVEAKMAYKAEVKRDTICNTFLVVADKTTQEATLVPVDYALLAPDIKEDEEDEQKNDDYSSALQTLKKQFGSKRTKLMAQQEERMRINTANTTKSLEETVAEMDVEESDLEVHTDDTGTTYKPPINRDAPTVDEVYDLYSLVPKEVLKSLDGVIANEDVSSLITTNLVEKYIKRKGESGTSKKHCKILLVVDCILKFLSIPIKLLGNKKHMPCAYSEHVSKYILDTFTVAGRRGRNRSASMKDKAMCHCIVLLALVNEYTVELEDFCKELKVTVNKLVNIARLLAFSPTKNRSTVVLKLPLPSPVVNLGRNPKRKR